MAPHSKEASNLPHIDGIGDYPRLLRNQGAELRQVDLGLVEILDTAFDETDGEDWNAEAGPQEPPSIAEMASQASRVLSGRNPVPVVVRVPDNSSLNPNGVLSVSDLVPGVFVPLVANLPGRALSQMQKLDRVRFEETGEGETIQVTLSPAPVDGSNAVDE